MKNVYPVQEEHKIPEGKYKAKSRKGGGRVSFIEISNRNVYALNSDGEREMDWPLHDDVDLFLSRYYVQPMET